MGSTVGRTIAEFETNKYTWDDGIDQDAFTKRVEKKAAVDIYHYASKTKWKGKRCRFYLVVDKQSKKIVKWDYELINGEKGQYCDVAG